MPCFNKLEQYGSETCEKEISLSTTVREKIENWFVQVRTVRCQDRNMPVSPVQQTMTYHHKSILLVQQLRQRTWHDGPYMHSEISCKDKWTTVGRRCMSGWHDDLRSKSFSFLIVSRRARFRAWTWILSMIMLWTGGKKPTVEIGTFSSMMSQSRKNHSFAKNMTKWRLISTQHIDLVRSFFTPVARNKETIELMASALMWCLSTRTSSGAYILMMPSSN